VVFQAEVGDVVAERQQKMIFVIEARAEELSGLSNKTRHALLHCRTHVDRSFAVGNDINLVVDRLARWSDVDRAIILAGDHGRIDEAVEKESCEGDFVAGLTLDVLWRAEFPPGRQMSVGLKMI
jgi:hypothetical protein